MRHSFTTARLQDLAKAEDLKLPGLVRSATLHELMDQADESRDNELWHEIAEILVRACDIDDLTPQVSDHFVRDCPDEIFVEVAEGSPAKRFYKWRNRAAFMAAK